MAGIGNEPFHLLGRFLLRVEAFLNTRQHGVQRHGQRSDFRIFRQIGNTLAQIPCRNLRSGLLDTFQRSKRALHDDGTKNGADQHHRDADHGTEPRQRVGRVDLVTQRQSDEHDAAVFDLPRFGFLAPRQRHNTPRRLRGLHDGMIRHPAGGNVHHRLCGERLSERDPVDTAVGRQTRLGHHALTEHRHRPSAGTLVFAVPHLDIIRVHQAPAILARGAVQRIHAIENHLRLIHQLRVGFL